MNTMKICKFGKEKILLFIYIFHIYVQSCHFDRTSNNKFSVEFGIFVIVIFFNPCRVLKVGDNFE